ncbi:single-stranded DNA-binding protein [Nocardia salmonicida]|uniref:single-stranded DNA-binding protein n=1 Tax=Nocardia salmonicida TaxID=53431 RepID=UPI0033E5E647
MNAVRIEITGHLADTPELRLTGDGTPVTNFTLMANARRYDEDRREWVDTHTTAIRITAWRNLAENVVGTIGVGTKIQVTGSRLTAEAYLGRDGSPRASLELTADTVTVDVSTQTAVVTRAPRPAA